LLDLLNNYCKAELDDSQHEFPLSIGSLGANHIGFVLGLGCIPSCA